MTIDYDYDHFMKSVKFSPAIKMVMVMVTSHSSQISTFYVNYYAHLFMVLCHWLRAAATRFCCEGHRHSQ